LAVLGPAGQLFVVVVMMYGAALAVRASHRYEDNASHQCLAVDAPQKRWACSLAKTRLGGRPLASQSERISAAAPSGPSLSAALASICIKTEKNCGWSNQ